MRDSWGGNLEMWEGRKGHRCIHHRYGSGKQNRRFGRKYLSCAMRFQVEMDYNTESKVVNDGCVDGELAITPESRTIPVVHLVLSATSLIVPELLTTHYHTSTTHLQIHGIRNHFSQTQQDLFLKCVIQRLSQKSPVQTRSNFPKALSQSHPNFHQIELIPWYRFMLSLLSFSISLPRRLCQGNPRWFQVFLKLSPKSPSSHTSVSSDEVQWIIVCSQVKLSWLINATTRSFVNWNFWE